VEFGDALESKLESIAQKKNTNVEDLLKERVIQEWIGKRRIVNQRVFEERSKRPRRTNTILKSSDHKEPGQ
jgi:hypothetical protein